MTTAGMERLPNPLQRAANAIPSGLASGVAVATKLAAVALALFIAFAQSYDETQVFAVSIAAIGLITLVPAGGRMAGAWSVFGAAMLLYAGALLVNVSVGSLLLVVGAIATTAALVVNQQRTGSALFAVAALFAAMGAITALVFVIVFAVGG